MGIILLFIIECISGFILFARKKLHHNGGGIKNDNLKVSVIIPARNEEKNLPYILDSLMEQSLKPYEIIVVDDFSSDRTREIAGRYNVKVIDNSELPENWTGKNWALWNGFLNSSGDILVFLDADVRLAPRALELLLEAREKSGGAISVVPYHFTEKFYEKLSLVPYILGVLAFTSPFEKRNPKKGLYGSCIITKREDYERINGHYSIRCQLLDDLNLGKRFLEAGINVENFIGYNLVGFRMYPNGLVSEIQGFSKGAVLSTASLKPATISFIAVWVIGLFSAGLVTPFLFLKGHPWAFFFLTGYIIYTSQILYFLKYIGKYGKVMPVLNLLSSMFFILIMMYSIYQVVFLKSVSWKGRRISVGGSRRL